MIITNETKIYGSFSESPGNNGATFFNNEFKKNGINALYLPIKCVETDKAVSAMRVLNFSGASFSKPHKTNILSLLDSIDPVAKVIGAVNTVINHNNILVGFNTDWYGAYKIMEPLSLKKIYIYGKGGFSKSIQYACQQLEIEFFLLHRDDLLPEGEYIFNASPVEITNDLCYIIDGRPQTETGKQIFYEQAKLQYELYTNRFN